jgi:hypothetical protein
MTMARKGSPEDSRWFIGPTLFHGVPQTEKLR